MPMTSSPYHILGRIFNITILNRLLFTSSYVLELKGKPSLSLILPP